MQQLGIKIYLYWKKLIKHTSLNSEKSSKKFIFSPSLLSNPICSFFLESFFMSDFLRSGSVF